MTRENTIRMTRTKAAYTFVEVLVVIGIVAVLASLMFPVFGLAKERAKRTVGATNMRQLAVACNLYAADAEDWLPPYVNFEPYLESHDPDVTSVGLPTNSRYPGLLKSSLMPYLRDDSMWYCPTDPYAHVVDAVGQINHDYTSYRYMPRLVDMTELVSSWPPAIPCSKMRPTGILFFEAVWFREKEETSYWTQPIYQGVGIDGHLSVFSLPFPRSP